MQTRVQRWLARWSPTCSCFAFCILHFEFRSSLSLVADGLLPDPGHRRVHDRARHAVARLEPLRAAAGYFAHWCARTWSRLILATTGVRRRRARASSGSSRDRTYVFVSNHQSIYDIPIIFWSLPYQLRIIAKESLGRFPFLGWHLRRTGHMLVDRRHPDRAAIFGRASQLTSKRVCR